MTRDKLKEFFDDKAMMRAWAEFMLETLKTEASSRVLSGKATTGLKEAQDIIDKSFVKLAQQFTPKPKPRKSQRAV